MTGLEYILYDLISSCIKVAALVAIPYLGLRYIKPRPKPPEALPAPRREFLPRSDRF